VIEAEFTASLPQSSVSHDPSEIIAAQESFLIIIIIIIIIINVESSFCCLTFLWNWW